MPAHHPRSLPPARNATPLSLWLWRSVVVPLAIWLCLLAMAAAQGDLSSGAELRFLGLMAAGSIAALGALDARRPIAEWTAAAVILAAWCLAESTLRGSFISALLLAALVFAALTAQSLRRPLLFSATAIVWQLLTRPDLLLSPLLEARTLVSIGVLPLAAGLALARLAAVHGIRTAWILGLALAVVAPGFNVAVTMALVAVAVGSFLEEGWWQKLRSFRWAIASVVLLASIAAWPLSLLVAVASSAGPLTTTRRRLAAAIGALALFVAWRGAIEWTSFFELAGLALVALPCGFLAFAWKTETETGILQSRRLWALGLALCAAGLTVSGDPEALAPGLLILAPCIRGEAAKLQLNLGLALAVAVGLAAGYPWLHGDPLLLIERPAVFALAALAIAVLGAGLTRFSRTLSTKPLWLAALALALVLVPDPPLAMLEQARMLDSAAPEAIWELTANDVGSARIDSNMVHGAHLEVGTVVASLELLDSQGQIVATAELIAGEHTADWAAGRADIAALHGLAKPEPWSRRPSPDGSFFEQRYRASLSLQTPADSPLGPVEVAAVRMKRHPDLPDLTGLVVRRLELRR